jgi:dCTP deaminase
MDNAESSDSCLASQEIRSLIERGVLYSPTLNESRIQPSSFDSIIGDEMFILDTEGGLFRPQENQSVYKTLLKLPKRRRQQVNISGGFEVKKGYSYLLRLEEKIKREELVRFILSSPKSSIGRLFPNTRLLADYNAGFDEIHNFPKSQDYLDLWLLFQPLAFNAIISPGLSLNQLRFFSGPGAKLSPQEILEEWKNNPLLWLKNPNGGLNPVTTPTITNALQIHLDLEGGETGSIVALKARKNPPPIDLRKSKESLAEEYFEPLKAKKGELTLKVGEHYLLASKEVLKIPPHLSAELGAYSHLGLSGPLHRAGFVDNGFIGDLVFEVTSQESTNISLRHNTPIGELNIFRTVIPDKVYSEGLGSHYYQQKGPKIAKYFDSFDFEFAARNYEQLDREVLVQDSKILLKHRQTPAGFEVISGENALRLFEDIEKKGFFHSRYDCETDSLILQVIPYAIVFGEDGKVFSYVRAKKIQDYGDKRLFGKHSIGLGGHIRRADGPEYILNCIKREVMFEEIKASEGFSKPKLLGTLFQPDTDVDKVHLGLVFGIHAKGEILHIESSIITSKMIQINDLVNDPTYNEKYETWGKVLIPLLPKLYEMSTPN